MVVHYNPPWANTHIIGIAGSSGSGKTSLALRIVSALNLPWVVILSMDSFYRPLSPEDSAQAFRNEYDFDSPSSIDFDTLVERLRDLKQGCVYSFEKHQRVEQTTTIYSCHVLILEGIFALYDPRVLELLDMKIFVDTDADVCLARRRGFYADFASIHGAIKQWTAFVKPNFELYVEPQRKNADIMVPRGIENSIAIDMIMKHIQRALLSKSDEHIKTLRALGQGHDADEPLPTSVKVLKDTPQLRAMHTILHDEETTREDFVFYFDRLATLLVERGSDHLAFKPKEVVTPQGITYAGLELSKDVSAVVILRSGGTLEVGLRRVVPDARIGRLLIQSNARTGEPELHYQNLPSSLAKDSVLVLDPQVATGAGALMAVTVLKDHGVEEERIVFVTYLAGLGGLRRLTKVFPKLKIIVGKIQEGFERRWIDERYFGS
ncbi:PRK-domain-containing protein [Tuber magnatum]|uniref:uridine/cytidine kinase n=1 Tax=Tuber magnatum TaxID=42249 RepID=A0A317SQ17_9PEZI|nr:PRK-domain-containing protein [Tuber magnatum]